LMSLLLALVLTSLAGCSDGPVTVRRLTLNQTITAAAVTFIVPGKTDMPTVVERLGAPNQIFPSKNGIVTRYYFTDGKFFKANYGWGLRFVIPFFTPDLDMGGGGLGTDVFQVTYDDRWLVREHAFAFHSRSSEFVAWPFGD
ncbi:MAG: hypothetical protein HP494_04210, partial [Nitrospira sp.]|nr:hypothetical protein [Nitrospira sp.]